ncbi:MAG: T9SS type A sorting domain-containing protein [Chitinophagaceae bacterium]|nr:T9SS type A sorting domain-containing protein [Chitinophagaceae bacterium]
MSLYSTNSKRSVEIRIINSTGQLVQTQTVILQTGKNEIGLQSKGLSRGVYLVSVMGEGVKESWRVVVE